MSAPVDPHEIYALANRHADHQHFVEDVVNRRDWIPAALECDRDAADEPQKADES